MNQELVKARAAEMRLDPELRELAALGLDRDWRQLAPGEIISLVRDSQLTAGIGGFSSALKRSRGLLSARSSALVARAVFVGTAQACYRGLYWAPSYEDPGAEEVKCGHLNSVSRIYAPDYMPRQDVLQRQERDQIACVTHFANCHPIEACARIAAAAAPQHKRIAMVHYTSIHDARNDSMDYSHPFEDQLFLRTNYFQAFERMNADVGQARGAAIDAGGLVFTPGVGILRGALAEGALWLREPVRADVLWVGLDPRPQREEQEQYAQAEDRQAMAQVIDRIFALAASHEVDALVFPPLGCGTHGCHHPALDVADLFCEAMPRWQRQFDEIAFASDWPPHFLSRWWEEFTHSVEHGRPPIEHSIKVPWPPHPRIRRLEAALEEKHRQLQMRPPRLGRDSWL